MFRLIAILIFVKYLAAHGISIPQKISDVITPLNTILKQLDIIVQLLIVMRAVVDLIAVSVVQISWLDTRRDSMDSRLGMWFPSFRRFSFFHLSFSGIYALTGSGSRPVLGFAPVFSAAIAVVSQCVAP